MIPAVRRIAEHYSTNRPMDQREPIKLVAELFIRRATFMQSTLHTRSSGGNCAPPLLSFFGILRIQRIRVVPVDVPHAVIALPAIVVFPRPNGNVKVKGKFRLIAQQDKERNFDRHQTSVAPVADQGDDVFSFLICGQSLYMQNQYELTVRALGIMHRRYRCSPNRSSPASVIRQNGVSCATLRNTSRIQESVRVAVSAAAISLDSSPSATQWLVQSAKTMTEESPNLTSLVSPKRWRKGCRSLGIKSLAWYAKAPHDEV